MRGGMAAYKGVPYDPKRLATSIHLKAKTSLKAPFETFAKNICKNISKVAFRVVLAL